MGRRERGQRGGSPSQLCSSPTELPSHETPRLRGNAAQRARVPAKRVHCGGLLGEWGTGGGGGHRHRALCPLCCLQFEAFYAGGLAPGWNLLVQGHSDSGEDK